MVHAPLHAHRTSLHSVLQRRSMRKAEAMLVGRNSLQISLVESLHPKRRLGRTRVSQKENPEVQLQKLTWRLQKLRQIRKREQRDVRLGVQGNKFRWREASTDSNHQSFRRARREHSTDVNTRVKCKQRERCLGYETRILDSSD